MASILISGPPAGGKTQEALARLGTTTRNSVLADFSSIYNSITGTDDEILLLSDSLSADKPTR